MSDSDDEGSLSGRLCLYFYINKNCNAIDVFSDIVEQFQCNGDYFPFESGIFAMAFMLLSSPRPMVMQFIWSAVNCSQPSFLTIGRTKFEVCFSHISFVES
jgi:hypothetical protein